MRSVFTDTALENEFAHYGYLTYQLLNKEDIEYLMNGYNHNPPPDVNDDFYTTHWSQDLEYRKKIDSIIRKILSGKVLCVLNSYKSCYGYFMVKKPSEENTFTVHQDWSFVDERYFRGATVWVALTDTNEKNGCLHVVPGSHLFSSNIRGTNIKSPYKNIRETIQKEYCQPLRLKAGQAVIFDHRLLHYSPPNITEKDRVAAGLVCIPDETTFIHYHLNNNKEANSVFKYRTNDNFLMDVGFGQIGESKYKFEKKFIYEPDYFSEEQFKKCILEIAEA